MTMRHSILIALLVCAAPGAHATVYAYVDGNGDYVVTQKRPGKDISEYAVLTDDGEFVRLVRAREPNVPITHWRPWFIPRETDPFDIDPGERGEREGTVEIDEVGR
jgi:hypothetical protein